MHHINLTKNSIPELIYTSPLSDNKKTELQSLKTPGICDATFQDLKTIASFIAENY